MAEGVGGQRREEQSNFFQASRAFLSGGACSSPFSRRSRAKNHREAGVRDSPQVARRWKIRRVEATFEDRLSSSGTSREGGRELAREASKRSHGSYREA